MYHFVSGIIYPLDHNGSAYLEEQSSENNLNDDEKSLEEQHEEVESNINSKSSRFTDDGEDEDPLEEKNIIDQSTQFKQSSCGINFITSVNEEIYVKYGFSNYEKENIETAHGKKINYVQRIASHVRRHRAVQRHHRLHPHRCLLQHSLGDYYRAN